MQRQGKRAEMSNIVGSWRKSIKIAGLVALISISSACVQIDRFHGFAPSEEDLAAVQIGQTTRSEVIDLFGPPMSDGSLQFNAIYYVSSQFRHFGAFPPKEIDRQVLAIRFDGNDVVRDMARYTLQEGQVVALDRRVTEDGINDVTFIGQLLGSFGRIDAGALLGDN
jgi:outer membrane protein assembly factor BamE (lipoprotein component of BamABCDE complex)